MELIGGIIGFTLALAFYIVKYSAIGLFYAFKYLFIGLFYGFKYLFLGIYYVFKYLVVGIFFILKWIFKGIFGKRENKEKKLTKLIENNNYCNNYILEYCYLEDGKVIPDTLNGANFCDTFASLEEAKHEASIASESTYGAVRIYIGIGYDGKSTDNIDGLIYEYRDGFIYKNNLNNAVANLDKLKEMEVHMFTSLTNYEQVELDNSETDIDEEVDEEIIEDDIPDVAIVKDDDIEKDLELFKSIPLERCANGFYVRCFSINNLEPLKSKDGNYLDEFCDNLENALRAAKRKSNFTFVAKACIYFADDFNKDDTYNDDVFVAEYIKGDCNYYLEKIVPEETDEEKQRKKLKKEKKIKYTKLIEKHEGYKNKGLLTEEEFEIYKKKYLSYIEGNN